jgi:hypothetical protein
MEFEFGAWPLFDKALKATLARVTTLIGKLAKLLLRANFANFLINVVALGANGKSRGNH